MKKGILGTITMLALMVGMPSFSGCAVTDALSYDNAEKYSVGGGSVSGLVTELEIDWLDGSVELAYGDVEAVTFSESSETELSTEDTLHYWLEGTTLHIKFAQSKKFTVSNGLRKKALKVVLPTSLALEKVDVEAVNANVKMDNLTIADVEITTVDGDVNAYLVGTTREISVETVEGDITLNANNVMDFDIETVGAEVYIESVTAPQEGNFEGVGGSLTLALFETEGFTFEVDTRSGTFSSDFETVKNGRTYSHGNGQSRYEAETVSGSIKVVKKTRE